LSILVGNISLWFYLPKYISKLTIKKLNIKNHIKPTISLFIPQIAMQIYLVLDKTMIGKIVKNMGEVGNYEQSQKILKVSLTVVTALGTVIAPRIANSIANNNDNDVKRYLEKSFKFVWLLATPIMFGIMAISKNLVPWFLGSGYEKSVYILIIGSLLILAIGLNNVTGIQYLIPAKKQNLYTKSVICGAIINFCLNLLLISKLGAIGAMIASVVAEISIFIIQMIYIKDIISYKTIFSSFYKNVLAGLIMFIIVYYVGIKMYASVIVTLIQIFVGFLIYSIIIFILKDEILYEVLLLIKTKIKGVKNE
jgi:O-antigen/teichoic acid export membrane protein